MGKKKKQDPSEIIHAILTGDIEKVKHLWETDVLLFKKGNTVSLRENIPQTYQYDGKEHTYYVDAFCFALSNNQTEIAKFLIDCDAVALNLGADALFTAMHLNNREVFSYMVEKGVSFDKSEAGINRLFLHLMDAWDDSYLPLIEKMHLPIQECGGSALCSAAYYNHMASADYLLSCGVSVNCRENRTLNTPVLCAARENHLEMVKFLVEHGADLSLRDDEGIRPYLAAKKNHHSEVAAYLKAHEPAELSSEEIQDKLFKDYHMPDSMADYLKNGQLKLEFPEEKHLHWIKLYTYMDVPELSYQGKKLLSLVEESEDYGLILAWEPQSQKLWFIDMEHEVFHAVCTWQEFMEHPGYYANRAVMYEFD